MKKTINNIILFITLLAGLSSCVQELNQPSFVDNLPYPEGEQAVVEMSAFLPSDIRSTKAMSENPEGITSMRVAVFGSSGFLKEVQEVDVNDGYFQSATTNGDGTLYRFKVKLTLTDSKKLRIHVIANLPSEVAFPWKGEDEVMRRYAYTEGTQDAYWCRFVLVNGLELKREYVDSTDSFEYIKDAKGYYQVTDEVSAAFTNLPLLRNFAKVTVESTTPQLILDPTTTMAIINKPRCGSIAPCLPTSGFVENYYSQTYPWLRENYDGFSPFDEDLVNTNPDAAGIFVPCTVSGSNISGGDFMYERPRETKTASYLLIHGKYRKLQDGKLLADWKNATPAGLRYPNNADEWLVPESQAVDGYYKIDFMDTLGYYAVFRNFRYHIRITGVSKPGAETPGAAGSTGGTGDISSSTEAQGLTDISDGYGRIAVSYVEMTLVNQHPMIELKYKFIPNIEEGDVPSNGLTTEDGPISITIGSKTGPVNVFSNTVDSSIPAGTDLGNNETGIIRVLPGNDAEGYRTIRFSTNAPSAENRTTQTIRITGKIDEHRSIFREVRYFLMEKQNMTVTCEADVPTLGYDANAVERVMGSGVNVKIKIPILLPESMFPLVFNLESDELSITPNTAKYPLENLPVESGESICDSKAGKHSFHYVRTLSYDEYSSLPDNNGRTIVCHFKTNKDVSASTIYVTNEYFNKASAAFTNYYMYYFQNPSFSNIRANVNDQTLTFSFSRDPEDNSGARTVKVTLDGLAIRGTGWGTISAEDGEYSWTIPAGSSTAELPLRVLSTEYSVTLEAFDGSTGKAVYHPMEVYNMDYLEADLQIGNGNYDQDPITLAGVVFDFDNVTAGGNNNNRYKQFGNRTSSGGWWATYTYNSGSVTITAPSSYTIVSIAITYTANNYSQQTVTYSPAGNNTTKNNWYGNSDKVVVTMNSSDSGNNYNRVNRITVQLVRKN